MAKMLKFPLILLPDNNFSTFDKPKYFEMKANLPFIIILLISMLPLRAGAQSSCTASFTYTLGSSGLINLTSTSTGLGGGPRYQWTTGDGGQATGPSSTYSYNYQYNGTYLLTLFLTDTTTSSCSDSINTMITITNAAVPPCVSSAFTYTASSGQVTFSLSATAQYASWNFGDGYTSPNNYNNNGVIHNYTNGTYTVNCVTKYLNNNGQYVACNSTSQVITIGGATCHAGFTPYMDTAYHSVLLYDQSFLADTVWYYVNGVLKIKRVGNSQLDTIALQAGSNHICQVIEGQSGTCHDSVCYNLNVAAWCTISVTRTLTCGQIALQATCNQTISSSNYYLNNVLVSTAPNPVITYTAIPFTIRYNIQSTGGGGCSAVDSVTFGLFPYFNAYADTAMGPHYWNVYVYNLPNYVSYHWSWGDGTSSYSPYPSHTYAAPGYYNICLTIHDNCGDSATYCKLDTVYKVSASQTMVYVNVLPVNSTASVKQNSTADPSVYPIPTSDYLYIDHLTGNVQIEIYDNGGRKVFSELLNLSGNKSALNVQRLEKGFYFVQIRDSDGRTYLNKMVKE